MTRDEIIEAAWKSGVWIPAGQDHAREQELDRLERFAELVAAAEREACTRACEDLRGTVSMFATSKDCRTHNNAITCCAEAIRARGES